jgi:N-acetylglucosamine kinase-like BadF-type ATPase
MREDMAESRDLLLVIEGGGSKGRAAVARDGRMMGRSLPAGLNPNDMGPNLLKRRFEALILPLLESDATPIRSLLALAAIAGAGRREAAAQCARVLETILRPRCSVLRLKVTSDADALLERFFASRDGLVLIAGTGSVCLGVRRRGGSKTAARAGGWGSYLDRGCGFSLGLGVLAAAVGALDGRLPRTPVVELLCARYSLELGQVPERFLPVRLEEVAGLARVALEASQVGDPHARKLVREAVLDLAGMVLVVAAGLGLSGTFDVALSGGLFENLYFMRSFKRALRHRAPSAATIHVTDPLACLMRPEKRLFQ